MKKKASVPFNNWRMSKKPNMTENKQFLHCQSFVSANLCLAQKPYKHTWKKGSVKNISPHPFN